MIRLQCLQESFISFSRLNKDWKWDKRYPEQAIQRFIAFNREIFSFYNAQNQKSTTQNEMSKKAEEA